MQVRGTARFGVLLLAIVSSLILVGFGPVGEVNASPATPSAPLAAPPDTITDFYPDEANLSDCVGLVEKPGCGSDARGGWRQTLVFVALFIGLGVILWRVSRGIRANRAVLDSESKPQAGRS